MTLTEKKAMASLLVSALIYSYLSVNLADAWTIPDQSAQHLWSTWIIVLGFGMMGEVSVGAWSAWQRKRGELEDDRDEAIIARAERLALVSGFCGINVLIWQILWQATFSHPIITTLDVQHLPTLFFVLMSILFLCHGVKQFFILLLSLLST
ncbi:hypothetical protein [Candidatus Phycosocius spiralis]|uniref:Uncharacterized protein n=1 Tax=Candidatus Phycosocius spiralis TaxID=2815099 RepID=A0ABQ4PWG9_9PROT|nr:hypothetical protein [Candidatus Phycosocius spiralis]GIU67280.1 hypothetical protein PsB1_1434 [Candidatus Phycosocius spiralis]